MDNTYDMWNLKIENLVYVRFRRCLKANIKESWDQILTDQPNRTDGDFELQLEALTYKDMGLDAIED